MKTFGTLFALAMMLGLSHSASHAWESAAGRCSNYQLRRGCYETYERTNPPTLLCVCPYFTEPERQGRCAGRVLSTCKADGHSSDYCVELARNQCGIR